MNLTSSNASEATVRLNFAKVSLLFLSISNALLKLYIRFLAVGKPTLLACMAVENKFQSICPMLIIKENCIAKIGSHF